MVPSKTIGELALMRFTTTQFWSTKSDPNRMRHISTVSSARSGAVTEPMNGLSDSVMCASTMSRWRLLTATSVGSHTVPPEWCIEGAM